MLFMALSIGIPYYISIKKVHQAKVVQLSQGIISEKKRHLADTINRTFNEIECITNDVISEYGNICATESKTIKSLLQIQNMYQHKLGLPATDSGIFQALQTPAQGNIEFAVMDSGGTNLVASSSERGGALLLESLNNGADLSAVFPVIVAESFIDDIYIYVYVLRDNVEKIIKDRVKGLIRSVRLVDGGYIWINQIENYEGGDDYAIRLVHPNLPLTEGMKLSTNMEDAHGNLPYKTELEGVKQSGGLYFEYYFKRIDSDSISRKLTYAKLYRPYNWIIATGAQLDDVDAFIKQELSLIEGEYKEQVNAFGLVIMSMVMVSMVALIIFEFKINRIVNEYIYGLEISKGNLRREKTNVQSAYEKLKSVAYTDYLTGLLNRRAIYKKILKNASRCSLGGEKFCIIIADIDHFKSINDSFGHDCGDYVLKQISKIIQKFVRAEDMVSRWGGEEFLIVGAASDISKGVVIAEKLRQAVYLSSICYRNTEIKITVTIGVSEFNSDKSVDQAIREADSCLYHGKNSTRNCVVPFCIGFPVVSERTSDLKQP